MRRLPDTLEKTSTKPFREIMNDLLKQPTVYVVRCTATQRPILEKIVQRSYSRVCFTERFKYATVFHIMDRSRLIVQLDKVPQSSYGIQLDVVDWTDEQISAFFVVRYDEAKSRHT